MKKTKLFFITIFLSVFYSCGAGISDFTSDLGRGYFYLSDGGVSSIENYKLSFNQQLHSQVIDYEYDSLFIIAKQRPKEKDYLSSFTSELISNYDMVLYEKDSSQLPMKRFAEFKSTRWWLDTTLRNTITQYIHDDHRQELSKITPVVEEALKTDSLFIKLHSRPMNYWIIVKKTQQLYGPLSYDQFLIEKNKLRVPNKLQLDK